ncbi:MAG: DNA gyrase subunit A [Defluviitaleaceae bacterium]|nr:DNA gyrase subunit A [Defluviitaleaceae bacterium]
MKQSFIDYSMSVIAARALPDVRDGLKPVHRRILYSMNDLGMHSDKPYKKSARIVGDVIAKYHPHGDSSVYDAMVRMAQDFSYRSPLVDGHGNFGSVDGDGAAAMRYTEARMSKLAMELVRDINKDTVDFVPNFDEEETEPSVLPAKFPNLLVNGTTGIAVGMATNIAPHNLGEVIDGCVAYIDNREIEISELMVHIKGPDLPTGATILGTKGIKEAYETGKGKFIIRSTAHIVEDQGGKSRIIVTEIPYQVNREVLIEKMADLVKQKRLDGITDIRNESNREGTRIVIELRKDINASVMLNQLFKQTQLQISFSINMLALVGRRPQVLNLKEILSHYVQHQFEVVTRKTEYDLRRAEARAHILEGYRIALDNIDRIIQIIRGSQTDELALNTMMSEFDLTEIQGKAILDMQLRRLTGLQRDRVESEYADLLLLIADLKDILANEMRVYGIIRQDLIDIKEKYADARKTEITVGGDFDIEDEDLIPREQVIITITEKGYVKRQPTSTYRQQNRGGRGIQAMGTNDDDFVRRILTTSTHDYLLYFTNVGKVYVKKAYMVPESSRTAKGIPIVNLIDLAPNEVISAVLTVSEFKEDEFLFFATKQGIVKRTSLSEFARINRNGKIALGIRDEDELLSVRKTTGNSEIVIASSGGNLVWFDEQQTRQMGRSAAGVRGIKLSEDEVAISMELVEPGQKVLVVSENGLGKQTPIEDYRKAARGTKGVKTINMTEKTGALIGMKTVNGDEDLLIITNNGIIIRTSVDQIATLGRSTQGVKVMKVAEEQSITSITLTEKEEVDVPHLSVDAEAYEE